MCWMISHHGHGGVRCRHLHYAGTFTRTVSCNVDIYPIQPRQYRVLGTCCANMDLLSPAAREMVKYVKRLRRIRCLPTPGKMRKQRGDTYDKSSSLTWTVSLPTRKNIITSAGPSPSTLSATRILPPRTPSSSAASITRTQPSGAAAVLARISCR